jgi:hypothetical protein
MGRPAGLIATCRRRMRGGDERGFVLVWMAIVLFVLLGVAAFAVDLVHAYAEGQHLQNALDAGALAGATEIPNGSANAQERSCELLANNFDGSTPCVADDDNRVHIDQNGIDPEIPNQMDVEGTIDVDTFFARILGVDKLTVRKRAAAQYDAPLAMGSPANNFGDIPPDSCPDGIAGGNEYPCASTSDNAQQNLWAQIMGTGTTKGNGNSFTTATCSAGTDGCASSSGTSHNNEYDDDVKSRRSTEFFSIVQDDQDNAPIRVFVYDAGYVDVGVGQSADGKTVKTCSVKWTTTPDQLATETPVSPIVANGKTYAENSPYCAGDTNLSGSGSDSNFDTNYTVYEPNDSPSPFDNTTQAGTCSTTVKPTVVPPGPDPDLEPPPPEKLPYFDPSLEQAKYFENWVNICSIPDGGKKGTEWVLGVSSPNADAKGVNNFSIMALHDGNHSSGHLQVMSRQRLPLFAAKPLGTGSPSTFYAARVLPSNRPRTLRLSFFDLGDTQGGLSSTGTLSIKSKNATFPDGIHGCTITTPVSGSAVSSPLGPTTFPDTFSSWGDHSEPGDCSFPYDTATLDVSKNWNRQWVEVTIPIPSNYNCTIDDPNICWIQLEIAPTTGSSVLFDATTWTARMDGAPVRLVG